MGDKVDKKARKEKKAKKDEETAAAAAVVAEAAVADSEKKDKKKKKKKKQKREEEEEEEEETEEPTHKKRKKQLVTEAEARAAAEAAARKEEEEGEDEEQEWRFECGTTPDEAAAFLAAHGTTVRNAAGEAVARFAAAAFPARLAAVLARLGFAAPSGVQGAAWPPLLRARDAVAIAATGSGKTLAFAVPLLLRVAPSARTSRIRRVRALVMAPTRELAMQIHDTFASLADAFPLTAVCLYGGAPKQDQRKLLRAHPDIVIATPGRLLDFMNDGECDISDVSFFVLDEADRMLDLGFEPNIRDIVAAIKNKDRQTVMFSATWPQSVMNLSKKYLKDPVHITVGSKDLSANVSIEQRVEVLPDNRAKESRLAALLKDYHKSRKNRIMIFALYKKEAARLESFVRGLGYNCTSIHGDLSQDRRSAAIAGFRDGSCPLLIATDVAARGIDVPNVEYVINFTYPLTTEDYCHRIGRTGRAGATGIAHTFFTALDKAHSGALINVLKQAGQKVPDELMKFGTTVKKKLDANYGAFTKDIDPSVKATKITFGDDDD